VVLAKFPGFYVTSAAGGFLSTATFFHRISFLSAACHGGNIVFHKARVYISVNCVYFQRAVTVPCKSVQSYTTYKKEKDIRSKDMSNGFLTYD
jgi:hypothetical protein